MTAARGSAMMSLDTSGSSDTATTSPYRSPAASSRKMSLTSSTLVGRLVTHTTSAREPTGTGTRSATPSKRPWMDGTVLAVASAAPVLVGTMLAAPARPRRHWRAGPSTRCWLEVYAWTVVMVAFRTPMLRYGIATT